MALSKLQYNSINVTPSAGKAIRFNSGVDGFETASAGGNMALIKTTTLGSSAASISFVDGASSVVLDSTYKEYVFFLNNIHPANDDIFFEFNGSIDTGSNYNVTKTTSFFAAEHNEGDSTAQVAYSAGDDLSQGTGYARLFNGIGNGGDESLSGVLRIFEPSNTTFVKHFIARIPGHRHSSAASDSFVSGYFNTTSAVDAIDFKMSSGNIDAGTISLYGVL